MSHYGPAVSRHGLDLHGISTSADEYWNLSVAQLYERAVLRREGIVAQGGPLVATTGEHTGRSANDKFIVEEPSTHKDIWWGPVNRSISQPHFDGLRTRMLRHLAAKDLHVFNGYAGADPQYRLKVRVVTEFAWHSLFARNMFIVEPDPQVLSDFTPDFTVIDAPSLLADPAQDGTQSGTFIALDFGQRTVLIGGTAYAGEIKKSIFTAMNHLLPARGVLPMHCSANYGSDQDDVALFFGLSGTGKTTLSSDSSRTLIGDDEHGWSDAGVFNFEGGCYAKVIRLDSAGEPEIYATTGRFGTILENVVVDPQTRALDLNDARYTENTRSSYPLSQLSKVDLDGCGGHPKAVVFLTADAFGTLPPISRLTREQAMYHFLSGYTAKVAGTERGVTEPSATFSACFGAPFMPRHPSVYAQLLGQRLAKHEVPVWLINTGWTGGGYGVGSRIKLSATRRMVEAALTGELENTPFEREQRFGLAVPQAVQGVESNLLRPRATWADEAAYDQRAGELAQMFRQNFAQYADATSSEIAAAGPPTG